MAALGAKNSIYAPKTKRRMRIEGVTSSIISAKASLGHTFYEAVVVYSIRMNLPF